ncbi:hypothetical protein RFI_04083 [Reticulomyxa filosa]|uniref:Uncharacterized protein n=1 Tax=Reticulomyxa filosa TaxID=46433 RepID=X6P4H1_RETFI|nr:hypothetical protein RFI_04083 [Reticulomyxa filosa]|eukprot:ETO33023.1 hypothetical protein RFI_04083 [Reticulomyxa filosa]
MKQQNNNKKRKHVKNICSINVFFVIFWPKIKKNYNKRCSGSCKAVFFLALLYKGNFVVDKTISKSKVDFISENDRTNYSPETDKTVAVSLLSTVEEDQAGDQTDNDVTIIEKVDEKVGKKEKKKKKKKSKRKSEHGATPSKKKKKQKTQQEDDNADTNVITTTSVTTTTIATTSANTNTMTSCKPQKELVEIPEKRKKKKKKKKKKYSGKVNTQSYARK